MSRSVIASPGSGDFFHKRKVMKVKGKDFPARPQARQEGHSHLGSSPPPKESQ